MPALRSLIICKLCLIVVDYVFRGAVAVSVRAQYVAYRLEEIPQSLLVQAICFRVADCFASLVGQFGVAMEKAGYPVPARPLTVEPSYREVVQFTEPLNVVLDFRNDEPLAGAGTD